MLNDSWKEECLMNNTEDVVFTKGSEELEAAFKPVFPVIKCGIEMDDSVTEVI
jgi:hypothetical protein